MATIKINFSEVSAAMRDMTQYTTMFRGYLSSMRDEIDAVAGKSWIGSVATEFQKGFTKMDEKLTAAVSNVESAFETLKQNAEDSNREQEEYASEVNQLFERFM